MRQWRQYDNGVIHCVGIKKINSFSKQFYRRLFALLKKNVFTARVIRPIKTNGIQNVEVAALCWTKANDFVTPQAGKQNFFLGLCQ